MQGLVVRLTAEATTMARTVLSSPPEQLNFAWKDVFLIRISTVDHQHKRLFEILGRLSHVALTNMSESRRTDIAKVLKNLLEYVLFHFLAEEVFMKRVNYPQFKQHRAIHQAFTSQCLDVQSKFNDSTLDVDGALLGSLYQWLVVH
eukprot:RCo046112